MQNTQVFPQAAVIWPVAERHRSDLSLLNAIATGDRRAMQILYARYSIKVHRFVLRLIGDPSTAEDVLSEVFFEVWRLAGRFQRRSQVPTWILAIARHKAFSIKAEPLDEALDEETAEAIADEADGPHAILEKRDTGNLLRRCIQRLPRIHREYSIWFITTSCRLPKLPKSSVCHKTLSRLVYLMRVRKCWRSSDKRNTALINRTPICRAIVAA